MELLTEKQQGLLKEKILSAFAQKQNRNSAFSMRALSSRLGISSGALSEILKSKRKVSKELATKILSNLQIPTHEIAEVFNETSKRSKKNVSYQDLSVDQYYVLSEWYYLPLLNLIELDVVHSPGSLGKRLNLGTKVIQEALDRLERLNMIEKKGKKYVRTHIRYQTSEDIANASIKRYHLNTLELSEKAILDVGPELRDFSSLVLKLKPSKIAEFKKRIRDFQDEIADWTEEESGPELYQFNIHLYPLTKFKTEGN